MNAAWKPSLCLETITALGREMDIEDQHAVRFWIENASRFPDLSKYAFSVLSIPASEVAYERAFSSAGAYYSDARVRMGDRTLRNLMFVHANDPQLLLWREERRGTDDEHDWDMI